eukprot:1149523-Pelagomonas_calceolata.AAC.6
MATPERLLAKLALTFSSLPKLNLLVASQLSAHQDSAVSNRDVPNTQGERKTSKIDAWQVRDYAFKLGRWETGWDGGGKLSELQHKAVYINRGKRQHSNSVSVIDVTRLQEGTSLASRSVMVLPDSAEDPCKFQSVRQQSSVSVQFPGFYLASNSSTSCPLVSTGSSTHQFIMRCWLDV